MEERIKEILDSIGEVAYDWQNMTLRAIFTELDKVPGYTVYWGCWDEDELDTIFKGV